MRKSCLRSVPVFLELIDGGNESEDFRRNFQSVQIYHVYHDPIVHPFTPKTQAGLFGVGIERYDKGEPK